MATRSIQNLQLSLIKPFNASGAITKGTPVKFGADDFTVVACGAGDDGIGVATEDAVDGAQVNIAMYSNGGIVTVLVGTGGATRGKWAKMAADGLTDAAPGGGTVALYLHGKFLQTGVAGDLIGLAIQNQVAVSA